MRQLLALGLILMTFTAYPQALWRNFFTTNDTPIVDTLAGSNVTVQATTVAPKTRHFTVNAQTDTNVVLILAGGGPGGSQTNITRIFAYTNIVITTNVGGGVTLYGIGGLTDTNVVGIIATNAADWVGLNSTNYANIIGANSTNFTLLVGANGTNYANQIGSNGTNYSNIVGQNSTNFTLIVGQNNTNFTLLIGQNNTNYTDLKVQAATNVLAPLKAIGITVGDGSTVIPAQTAGYAKVLTACTIQSCTIMANAIGSIEFRVWRTNSADASFPPTSVGAIGTNSLSSDNYNVDATLSNWTTLLNAGDIIGWNIPSGATTISRATLVLQLQP